MDLYAQMYKPMMMHNIHFDGLDCYRCPYGRTRENCDCECFIGAEKAFAAYGKETAALIVEPILQGAAGMRIYPPEYYGACVNSVTSTASSSSTMKSPPASAGPERCLPSSTPGISPDILCTSKGLTGGYLPMSLTITTDAVLPGFLW